jgi:hypothetical protein
MSKDPSKRTLSPATAFTAVFSAVAGAVTGPHNPASKGRAQGSTLRRLMTFSLAFALLISAAAPLAPQVAAGNPQDTDGPAGTNAEQPADQPVNGPDNEPSGAENGSPAGGRFGTLPPGSTLPTGEECAGRVRRSPWEPRADNYQANHTKGKSGVQIDGGNNEANTRFAPRIDGNFTGTTDEIIQWGACKWGFDEDIVRAVAVNESTWRQSMAGDGGQSHGLLQVKDSVHDGTFPLSRDSTPFNVDYALAWRRSCFEGYFDWAKMPPGNDEWNCVGLWYSGDPNGGADNYLSDAKGHYQEKPWLNWPDESSKLPTDAGDASQAPEGNSGIPTPGPSTVSLEPVTDPAGTSQDTHDNASGTDANAGDTLSNHNADAGDHRAETNPDASNAPAATNADAGDTQADDAEQRRAESLPDYIRRIFELCDPRRWMNHNNSNRPDEAPADTPGSDEPGSSDSHLLIYDNGVAPDFGDGTFGVQSSEPCDTTSFVSEPCSYGAAFQGSGAFNFQVKAHDGLKTDPYLALEFKINTGGQLLEDLSALFTDMNDKIIKQVALSQAHVVETLENGWVHVVVPISELNPSNEPVLTIQIKNSTQKQLETMHVDDVQLSGTGETPASPTPSDSPTPEPSESAPPADSPEPSPSTEPAENPSPAPSAAPVTETGSDISGLHVQGNQLLNGENKAVQLRGVNHSGTEYACIQGNGIFEGPNDDASVKAIKGWNVNVVRVPMNEHCWLAVNGAPGEYSGDKYQQAIKDYVDLLTKNGIATILELHWTAPGGEKATGQKPMLNKDHSVEFWKQVAATFKDNQSVIFDPHNEPFPDGNKDTDAAWTCWRDGGNCSGMDFQAAGMQEIVDAIRGAGAKNVVMLGGVQYSNGLSQWLKYKPDDPENNLMASWHVYNFNPCKSTDCYDKTLKPVAEQVPIMAGEIGQNDCGSDFIKEVMNWLDQNGGHYAGWVWNTWGTDCGSISLITDYNGTPNGSYGQGFKDHLTSK